MDKSNIGGGHGCNWKGTYSMKKATKQWNILLSFLSNHLDGKTRSKKMEPSRVLTNEEDATIVGWILGMQECKLSINNTI